MIGVLALQGAFAEHEAVLTGLGYSYTEVRQRSHLMGDLDAMIIPGGESTVMNKLLNDLGMFDELKAMIEEGLPVFGTSRADHPPSPPWTSILYVMPTVGSWGVSAVTVPSQARRYR